VPARHLRNHGTGCQCLFQNPSLVIRRPPPPTAGTVDDLDAASNPFRLKRKVKPGHKTIPIPRPSDSPLRRRNGRCDQDDAYDQSATFLKEVFAAKTPVKVAEIQTA